MKTYLFKYLSQTKHRNYSINKNHYNILDKFGYKLIYNLTYLIYIKPYLNKLTKHTYANEFHTDLDSRFTEFSWLNTEDYSKYKTILNKARDKSHGLHWGW